MFSSQPPIVIFSPARRVRDNTTKHTLQNVLEVPEVAINMVTYNMVQQTSLASCEYAKDENEFLKAGFTMQPATFIKPFLVKESPVKLECKVIEVKPLGQQGGAGNLVICEVLYLHIDDELLDEHHKMIQNKLSLVARLGADWYCRIDENNLFEVPKPNIHLGIGFDALPLHIKNSPVLTGNDLGKLANTTTIPELNAYFEDDNLKHIIQYFNLNPNELEKELHLYAQTLLLKNKIDEAWQVLLFNCD